MAFNFEYYYSKGCPVQAHSTPYRKDEVYYIPFYFMGAPLTIAGYCAYRNGESLKYGFSFNDFRMFGDRFTIKNAQ